MTHEKPDAYEDDRRLLRLAADGDQEALVRLFSAYRERLKRMIGLRLSRRLSGRVDDSDVLQEAYLEVVRKLPEYARDPILPPFLWMRHLATLKLVEVHRRHLGSKVRDADREVTLYRGCLPTANSASLAAHLLGTLSAPSQAAIKAETRLLVQEALEQHGPDRSRGRGAEALRATQYRRDRPDAGPVQGRRGQPLPQGREAAAGDPREYPRLRILIPVGGDDRAGRAIQQRGGNAMAESESDSGSSRVLELAEEFLDRYRAGERPSLKEYIDRYPEHADEIREVFPALAILENIALVDAPEQTGPGTAT